MGKVVLVPVDGSDVAEAIVPFILDIAEPLEMEVIFLQVTCAAPSAGIDRSPPIEVEDNEACRKEAEVYLAGLAGELKARGVHAVVRVRSGDPVAEILAAAWAEDADLIAMSTYGRGNSARRLFGAVAKGVLRGAGIPVLLMRHTEREIARRRQRAKTEARR